MATKRPESPRLLLSLLEMRQHTHGLRSIAGHAEGVAVARDIDVAPGWALWKRLELEEGLVQRVVQVYSCVVLGMPGMPGGVPSVPGMAGMAQPNMGGMPPQQNSMHTQQ